MKEGVLAIVTFVIKNVCFARLAVVIRLKVLTAIPVSGIFQLNSKGTGNRTLPCNSEVCNGARKVCKLCKNV